MTSAEPDPTETVPDEPNDPRSATSTGVDGVSGAGAGTGAAPAEGVDAVTDGAASRDAQPASPAATPSKAVPAKKAPARKTPARATGTTKKASSTGSRSSAAASEAQDDGGSSQSSESPAPSAPATPAVKKPAARRTTTKKTTDAAASADAAPVGESVTEAESTAAAQKPARKPAARTTTPRTTTPRTTTAARTTTPRSTAAKTSTTKGAATKATGASASATEEAAVQSAAEPTSESLADPAVKQTTAAKRTTARTTTPKKTTSKTTAKTTAAKTTTSKAAAAKQTAATSAPTSSAGTDDPTAAPTSSGAAPSGSTVTGAGDSAESKAPAGSSAPAADAAPSDERPQKPVLAASDAAPTAILSSPAPTLPSAPPAPPKPQLSASEAAELFAAAPEPVTPQYRRSSPPPAPVDTARDDTAADDVTRPVWQQPTSLLPTVTPADDSAVSPVSSEQHDPRPSVNDDRTEILQLPDASSSGSRVGATSAGQAEEPARRVVFSKKWPFIALADASADQAKVDQAHTAAADASVAAPRTAADTPAGSVQPEAAFSETPAGAARAETAQSGAAQSETAQPGADALPGAAAANEPEVELTDEEIAAFGADPSWVDTESPLVEESSVSGAAPRDEDSTDAAAVLFGANGEPANTDSEASLVEARETAVTDDSDPAAAPAGSAVAEVDEEQEAAIDAIAVDAPEAHATPLGLIDSASASTSIDEERRKAGAPSYAAGSGVLSVSGLSKRFGDTVAVDGIDLEVSAGSFYGIVGPNGAGKTTTLSMITGLLRPDSGSITINGIDVWKEPDAAKRSIGVLPDHLRLFDRLTGSQLLYYSGVLRGIDGATVRSRVDDLAKAFGLEDALHRLVTDYSAGMTKKVALAAAMIHSPRMLVLDEPFESVDPVSAANVIEILQKYVDHGGTVVLSSHGMDLIQRVCDHVAIIVNGQVLAQGSVDEVRGTGTLEERFVELAGGRKAAEGMEWLHSFSD